MKFKAITLSEDLKVPEVIQLLRTGSFEDLDITKEILSNLKKNFDEKVRGYDDGKLPIDYFHENEKIAAGWIQSLTISADGTELWAEVKWTPGGAKKISEGELRYVSVEFSFDYKDNESGKKFGPTLFGAGLTNRPYVKSMAPIVEFSENKNKEKLKMTLEEAKKKIEELEEINGKMEKELSDMKSKYAENEKKMAENEKAGKFNKLLSDGKVVEAQRDAFMSDDMVKFSELAQNLNLDPKGTSDQGKGEPIENAQEKILELSEKMANELKISMNEAMVRILKSNKELAEKYINETSVKGKD